MFTHRVKQQYRITLELALLLSLVIITIILLHVSFNAAPKNSGLLKRDRDFEFVMLTDIETLRKAPPARPSVPIAVNDDPLVMDETIDSTDFDTGSSPVMIPVRPPKDVIEKSDEPVDFFDIEDPPILIGGNASILKNLKYPEMARMSRIEGTVVISVLIDETGKVVMAESLSDRDPYGFTASAIEAIRQCAFTPAKQRMKPVKCRINYLVLFRLQ